MRISQLTLALFAVVALSGALAAHAQTDVAVSGFGSITQTASGNGMTVTAPDSYGGLLEVRYIHSSLRGIEAAYSADAPQNHIYTTSLPVSPKGFDCGGSPCDFIPPPTSVNSFTQTLSVDWVPSMKAGNLRPFGVLGIGLLIGTPINGQVSVTLPGANGAPALPTLFSLSDQLTAAYVYGAGVDWSLSSLFGLRLQYRGEMYRAPGLMTSLYPATNAFIQTAQPSVGISFHL